MFLIIIVIIITIIVIIISRSVSYGSGIFLRAVVVVAS
jgi:hypothetical protein